MVAIQDYLLGQIKLQYNVIRDAMIAESISKNGPNICVSCDSFIQILHDCGLKFSNLEQSYLLDRVLNFGNSSHSHYKTHESERFRTICKYFLEIYIY